ncbi:MAG: hypothetical protein IJX36_04965, partial [Thermoguttaceae bacterium]|nr:hypothetical protein [Thermoguttaceae bacterium]
MPKNKRKSVSESAAEKKKKSGKAGDAKGMRTGVATLTICAAAFGAYYSPHFRTASSDWLERGRALLGRTSSTDESSKALASATDQAEEKWAQAPSFRDFLTDEYGEEGARELLGIEETAPDEPVSRNISVGILGLTHGCGVTSMTVAIAEHLAQNCRVKAIDLTGTSSLRFAKSRGVTYITHTKLDIPRIKATSRAVLFDFGAPFELSPKGKMMATSPH